MLYDTIAEYDTAIAEYRAAISRVATGGQSATVQIAGNARTFTEADLPKLREHLAFLQREKSIYYGNVGYFRAGG